MSGPHGPLLVVSPCDVGGGKNSPSLGAVSSPQRKKRSRPLPDGTHEGKGWLQREECCTFIQTASTYVATPQHSLNTA